MKNAEDQLKVQRHKGKRFKMTDQLKLNTEYCCDT